MAGAEPLLLLMIIMGSLLDQVWPRNCGVPVFREGAADLVIASFKKRFARTDFTKIDVDLTPHNLVEDSACINGDEMVLQYNNNGGENWTTVDAKATWITRGQYKFTMEDIVPCKDYYFKVLLFGEGTSYYQFE